MNTSEQANPVGLGGARRDVRIWPDNDDKRRHYADSVTAYVGAGVNPIDLVLDRLASYRLRPNGSDRWRACCPAHGGGNPSALSVGIGDNGAVLLRCWNGCDAESVSRALGLEVADLFPSRESGSDRPQRRRLLTAGQALGLLVDESTLVAVAAANLAHGIELTDADRARVLKAAGRIAYLREEVAA